MCKYCQEDSYKLGTLDCEIDNVWDQHRVYIYKGILRIENDSNRICFLNYCPMCGRNLKEEQHE